MYRKLVNLVRESWNPRLILWIDAFLSGKLFVIHIPGNLNYWRSNRSIARLFEGQNSFTLVDVGSRGAPPPEFDQMRPFTRCLGFDASDTAQAHAINHLARWLEYRIIQAFVGDENSTVEFKNFGDGGLPSCFEPSHEYVREFAPNTIVQSREEVQTVSLRQALGKDPASVDFLKLDTQGSELTILKSDGVCSIPLIEVEVEFIEVYQGQPLFDQVFSHLISNWCLLLWLTRHYGSPYDSDYFGRGSLVFGEALFGLAPGRALGLAEQQFGNYLALLAVLGHVDYASHLKKARPDLSPSTSKYLESVFRVFTSHVGANAARPKSFVSSILEKIQFFSGSSRSRHISFVTDSDRHLFFDENARVWSK